MDNAFNTARQDRRQEAVAAATLRATIGRNVSAARKSQKIKKHVFCDMANISRPTLNAIESGQADPRISMVVKLACALDVDPLYLLADHDPKADQALADRSQLLR